MCGNVKCLHFGCGKEFGSADLLRRHEKIHTNNYVCQECEKKYSSKQALERHLNIHKGVTYSCTFCNKKFNTKNNLKRHMKNAHE